MQGRDKGNNMSKYGIPTITKKQQEIIFGGTESRKPILASVKTEVYKRAKGCCESCGEKTEKSLGHFHHWRDPKISPTAKTVQFLCLKCHKKYGHKIKVVVHHNLFGGNRKESTILRLKVKKHPKKKIKKTVTRKKLKTKKKTTRKKTPKRKKKSTKKKSKRKSSNSLDYLIPKITIPKPKW